MPGRDRSRGSAGVLLRLALGLAFVGACEGRTTPTPMTIDEDDPATIEPPSLPPAATPRGSYVRVRFDTPLVPRPDPGAYSLLHVSTAGLPLRYLDRVGDYDELETIDDAPDRACGGHDFTRDYRLRLYAPAGRFADVLDRSVRQTWPDGAAIELAPGFPVDIDPPGFVARWGEQTLAVEIPDDAVASHWSELSAEPEPGPEPARGEVWVDRAAQLRYGPHRLTGLGRARAVAPSDEGDLRLTYAGPCGRLELLADADTQLSPPIDDPLPINRDVRGAARPFDDDGVCVLPRYSVAAGVPVFWPPRYTARLDGLGPEGAGETVRAHLLPEPTEEVGDLRCFRVHTFELCVTASAAAPIPDPACAAAGLVHVLEETEAGSGPG